MNVNNDPLQSCPMCKAYKLTKNNFISHMLGRRHQTNALVNKPSTSKSLLIKGLPTRTLHFDLLNKFWDYGIVNVSTFGKRMRSSVCIIEFVTREAAERVLKVPPTLNQHKFNVIPKWKLSEKDLDYEQLKAIISTKPIPISNLLYEKMGQIVSEEDLDALVLQLIDEIELKPPHIIERDKLRFIMENFLRPMFPLAKTYIFGSSANNLGFVDSDVDMYADLGFNPWATGTQGEIETKAESLTRYLASEIQKRHRGYNVVAIARARVPIIKFKDDLSNLAVDLSFRSAMPLCNTSLIKVYTSAHHIVRPYLMVIRYWAKLQEVAGGGNPETLLTNYCLTMMMLFCLMNRESPIVPSVGELKEQLWKDPSSSKPVVIEGWDCSFSNMVYRWIQKEHKTTLLGLMIDFFKFYMALDTKEWVVSPLVGTLISRQDVGSQNRMNLPPLLHLYSESSSPLQVNTPICVQDPFEHNRNISRGLKFGALKSFQLKCQKGLEICLKIQDRKATLNQLFEADAPMVHEWMHFEDNNKPEDDEEIEIIEEVIISDSKDSPPCKATSVSDDEDNFDLSHDNINYAFEDIKESVASSFTQGGFTSADQEGKDQGDRGGVVDNKEDFDQEGKGQGDRGGVVDNEEDFDFESEELIVIDEVTHSTNYDEPLPPFEECKVFQITDLPGFELVVKNTGHITINYGKFNMAYENLKKILTFIMESCLMCSVNELKQEEPSKKRKSCQEVGSDEFNIVKRAKTDPETSSDMVIASSNAKKSLVIGCKGSARSQLLVSRQNSESAKQASTESPLPVSKENECRPFGIIETTESSQPLSTEQPECPLPGIIETTESSQPLSTEQPECPLPGITETTESSQQVVSTKEPESRLLGITETTESSQPLSTEQPECPLPGITETTESSQQVVSTKEPESRLLGITEITENSQPLSTEQPECPLPGITEITESSQQVVSTKEPECRLLGITEITENSQPLSTEQPECPLPGITETTESSQQVVSTKEPECQLLGITETTESSQPVTTGLPECPLPGITETTESSQQVSTELPECPLPVTTESPESSQPVTAGLPECPLLGITESSKSSQSLSTQEPEFPPPVVKAIPKSLRSTSNNTRITSYKCSCSWKLWYGRRSVYARFLQKSHPLLHYEYEVSLALIKQYGIEKLRIYPQEFIISIWSTDPGKCIVAFKEINGNFNDLFHIISKMTTSVCRDIVCNGMIARRWRSATKGLKNKNVDKRRKIF